LSEQTTTKTLLPTVLLLLPSFQALQFQYIYNLDDYTSSTNLKLNGMSLSFQNLDSFTKDEDSATQFQVGTTHQNKPDVVVSDA
jgi:hypothetical protein